MVEKQNKSMTRLDMLKILTNLKSIFYVDKEIPDIMIEF